MNIKDSQSSVRQFHEAFDLTRHASPTLADPTNAALRVSLIQEELDEYATALQNADLVEVADALGDLLYVVLGAGVSHGIDLQPVFDEIHRSNMTKVGGHKDDRGKLIKPDTYEPARVAQVIMQQKLASTPAGREFFDDPPVFHDLHDPAHVHNHDPEQTWFNVEIPTPSN